MRRPRMRFRLSVMALLFAVLLESGAPVRAATAGESADLAEPPPAFRALYNALAAKLAAFEASVDARWNGSRADVTFAAELLTANANRGTALRNATTYAGVELEMGRLVAMGLTGITISLGFPLLDPSFYGNGSEFQVYLDFYRRVVADARAANLKVIVDAGVLFPTYVDLPVESYYRSLTYDTYIRRRVDTIVLTARELRPDWLGFGAEPDTEQSLTGFPVASPAEYTAFANAVVENVTAAALSVPLGAGVGTWDPQWREYATSYAQNTSLAFVDLHVYPINFDFLPRLWDLAGIAKAGGKAVAIGEAWMYKASDAELSSGVYYDDIFLRDAYDFWAPLDSRFLWDLVNYSHAESLEFLSPYWSKFFHAYLDYDQVVGWNYKQVTVASNQAAAQAMVEGRLSATGRAYATAIGGNPGTPPTTPPPNSGVLLLVLAAVAGTVVLLVTAFRRRSRPGTIPQPPLPPPP